MSPLDAGRIRRRFLLLHLLRWLSAGLLVPVFVLLVLERGFSLAELGLIAAAQGLLVLLLELPTGGLADAIGRRVVLLGAVVIHIASIGLLIVADSMLLLLMVGALKGIYRALDSGALDAWYVDAAQSANADADIERGLAWAATVLGVSMGIGALASGGLVAIGPLPLGPLGNIDPLVLPLVAGIALEAARFVAIVALMSETRRRREFVALRQSVAQTPATVRTAAQLVWSSTALVALVSVELLWGFGMVAFENLTPAKLDVVLGNTEAAAALFGPVSAAAWVASAAGAALVPLLTRKMPAVYAAAAMRIAQGAAVVGIGLAGGPVGVVAAFVVTMFIHGAANPLHQGLLHRAVDGPSHRATVISANSMTALSGAAIGGLALGTLADTTTLTTALLVGAAFLIAAAPLYLVVRTPAHKSEPPARPSVTSRVVP